MLVRNFSTGQKGRRMQSSSDAKQKLQGWSHNSDVGRDTKQTEHHSASHAMMAHSCSCSQSAVGLPRLESSWWLLKQNCSRSDRPFGGAACRNAGRRRAASANTGRCADGCPVIMSSYTQPAHDDEQQNRQQHTIVGVSARN